VVSILEKCARTKIKEGIKNYSFDNLQKFEKLKDPNFTVLTSEGRLEPLTLGLLGDCFTHCATVPGRL